MSAVATSFYWGSEQPVGSSSSAVPRGARWMEGAEGSGANGVIPLTAGILPPLPQALSSAVVSPRAGGTMNTARAAAATAARSPVQSRKGSGSSSRVSDALPSAAAAPGAGADGASFAFSKEFLDSQARVAHNAAMSDFREAMHEYVEGARHRLAVLEGREAEKIVLSGAQRRERDSVLFVQATAQEENSIALRHAKLRSQREGFRRRHPRHLLAPAAAAAAAAANDDNQRPEESNTEAEEKSCAGKEPSLSPLVPPTWAKETSTKVTFVDA